MLYAGLVGSVRRTLTSIFGGRTEAGGVQGQLDRATKAADELSGTWAAEASKLRAAEKELDALVAKTGRVRFSLILL